MANTVEANIKINARADVSELNKLETSIDDIQGDLERLSQGSAFDNIDEEIKDVSKDTNDYSGILQALAKQLGLSNTQASGLAKTLGATAGEAAAAGAAIGVIVGVLKIYVDRLHEAENALMKFGEGALDAGVNGVEFFVDAIHTLVESLEEALSKMEEFAEAGAEIQTAYYNTFTILGEEAGNEVLGFADKLEHLYGLDGDELVKDMQSIVAAAGSLGVSTGDAVKATENMTIMAQDLSLIAGSFDKASNNIGNAISKGFVSRTSSLYVLMTKAEKDELKSLGSEVERYNYLMSLSNRIKGRYIDFLGTEAGQLMLLKAQYGQLVNNISKLALGLYAKIAPVLNKLIQLANIALTFIMRVFNIDLKSSANVGIGSIADGIADGMKKAGDSSKKAAKDIKKSTKDSGKAIKELERQVASFDDVIQIKDNKASDDLIDLDDLDDLDDGLDGLDTDGLSDLIGDFDLLGDAIGNAEDEFAEFKKLLDEGNYYGAGQWLAGWLADQLEAIPWDSIQAKARKTGAALAEFLNGINSDKRLWADIGHTIAEGLNTDIDFLLNFADLFDFREFGDSLGVAWKQFWDDFDEVEAAEALYEWFMGIFDLLGGLFETSPLSTMANSLVTMIHNFFNNFTEEDKQTMAETLKSILDDVFTSALILAEGLFEDSDKIIELMNNLLDAAIDWLDNGGDQKIEEIGQAIIGMLNKLKDSGLIQKVEDIIRRVMQDINLDEILSAATDIAMDVWAAKTRLKLSLIWKEIKAVFKSLDIPGALQTFGQLIIALLMALGAQVVLAVKNAWDFGAALADIVNAAKINIMAFFAAIGIWIGAKLLEIKTNLSKFVSDIITGIKTKFESILNTIKGWIQRIKDAITKPFQGLNPFSGMSFKLPSFNISMPYSGRHATGGITNGASIGMIGEAGREAVLPLERNTGWMDVLAEKIAGINGGGNNTPVVIDMSAANKPVYTRSEYLAMADIFAEAMKARGVAVSMEY